MDIKLDNNLDLSRCPHCSVDNPNLISIHQQDTHNHRGANHRFWKVYKCNRCGGLVLAYSNREQGEVQEIFPSATEISSTIPPPAREYIQQAQESIHSPAGSVMLAASAVDAMLKSKGYKKGNLHDRINKAAEEHLITPEMAKWAHEVRLDANEPRHSDEKKPLPNEFKARRILDFALALAQFLFVLPARVQRGLTPPKEDNNQ